jgi:RNA polymerase sigma-70 factor (ECF subfamily)
LALARNLDRLPLEQREVFALREFSGLSFKEIAELTQSPLNTVLGRMHLAVKKLRAGLGERGEA